MINKHNLLFSRNLEELISRADKHSDTKALWDILIGLRGPDDANDPDDRRERLRELTCYRLRCFIGIYPPTQQGDEDHYNDNPLELPQQKERDDLLSRGCDHFADHYWSAVDGVRKLYRYDLEKEKNSEDEESKVSYNSPRRKGSFG